MKDKLIAIVGPTASGKTALAVALAKRIGGEIVSSDSMQIYRGMEIGTAAPSEEEMDGVPHHLIGIIDADTPFSCADYVALADRAIREIRARGHVPIVCGGTGLYLDSLLRVDRFSDAEKDPAERERWLTYAEEHGAEALHARLAEVDPASAEQIHPNNIRRVVRALEIFHTTGTPKSVWDAVSRPETPRYDARIFVLNFHDRERLYARIDARVEDMILAGLEAEARALFDGGVSMDSVAAQAIGYKEFLPYFSGEATLDETVSAIAQASRRYAKRQLTWFRRYADAAWIYPDKNGADAPLCHVDELLEEIMEHLGEAE